MKSIIALALLAGATLAHAQSASAPAAAPVSAAKKELVAKAIALQAPILEAMARELIMRPVMQMGQAAGQALQNLPQDKRETAAKTIDAFEAPGGNQPGARIIRNPVGRPLFQRHLEGVMHRVFSEVEITQQSDQGGQDGTRFVTIKRIYRGLNLSHRNTRHIR